MSQFDSGNILSTERKSNTTLNNWNTFSNINQNLDPDEQFVLDIIRTTKQESIAELIDQLRLQESKCVVLVRVMERYKQQLESKDIFK